MREVRGIRKNTFVRLKDSTAGGDAIPSALHARELTRPEARRCHGRVVGFARVGGKRLVKLKEWGKGGRNSFDRRFWPGVGELSPDMRLANLDTYPSAHTWVF